MDENIVIRNATVDDAESLAQFTTELFIIEDDFNVCADTQMSGIMMLLGDSGRSVVLIAESGGVPVGMVTGQLVISTAAGGFSLLVEDMFVAGSFRGRGAGSKLFSAVVSWGESMGAVRVQLLYDTRNLAAKKFYISKKMKPGNMGGMYRNI